MDILSVYEATWFEGKFKFELRADSIQATGTRFLHSQIDSTIPLSTLQPRFDRVWIQSKSFAGGLTLGLIGIVGYLLLVRAFQIDPLNPQAVLLGLVGAIGAMLTALTLRKQEYAQFMTDAGVPVLAIPRSARQGQGNFDEFVELIQARIQECRRPR
jgi:hypothetical protein